MNENEAANLRHPGDESGDTSIPGDPTEEAREQLQENDDHLREGDEPTPEETVPRHDAG